MDSQQLSNILESCLLVAGKAMSINQLEVLFEEDIDRPERSEIRESLLQLQSSYEGRGIELVEVASGWRLQSSASMEHWVGRLFQDKAPRYSRALLETLVLIAYRQPITRGEIEDVRGVAVSSNIIRTLQERDWIKEMGFKDVPGKPALWGTTKAFLDYFNLKRLDELPTLAEARDLAEIDAALMAEVGLVDGLTDSVAANDSEDADSHTEGSSPVETSDDTEMSDTDDSVTEDSTLQDSETSQSSESSEVEQESASQSDLVSLAGSLAGSLGKQSDAPPQPDLSSLADQLDEDERSEGEISEDERSEDERSEDERSEDEISEGETSGDKPSKDRPAVAAVEISADDIEALEWNDNGDLSGPDIGPTVGQAESDLRQVIDDFAEEHRQQLAADEIESQVVRPVAEHESADPSPEQVGDKLVKPVKNDRPDLPESGEP